MQQTWCDVKWCKVTHPPSVTHRHTTASTERRRHRDGEQGIIRRITNQPGSHGRPQPLTCFIHPLIQTATAAKEEETRKLREERRRSWTGLLLNPCQRVHAWGLVINRQLHCPFQELMWSNNAANGPEIFICQFPSLINWLTNCDGSQKTFMPSQTKVVDKYTLHNVLTPCSHTYRGGVGWVPFIRSHYKPHRLRISSVISQAFDGCLIWAGWQKLPAVCESAVLREWKREEEVTHPHRLYCTFY